MPLAKLSSNELDYESHGEGPGVVLT